ncbi:mitochondrial ubiquitin ligase activator of NFKB 1-like [Babylonia areolata]|uniref:mitochondrial ubiquitin ligase activator of NFKB 1-like n=1 Tax=Babylonia areolata TaxID=304850 RepID=UPI003FD12162
MIDTSDKLIILGGSLSGIIAASLYTLYKSKTDTATQIKNAQSVQLGSELKDMLKFKENHSIDYASVEGIVTDLGKTFSTKNSSKQGVILQTSQTEHKSQRIHGFWTDAKTILRDTFDVAPFALRDPDNPQHSILVTEATEAEELLESLEVVHDQFIPRKTTAMQTGIDRLFGEVCHGIQETEEMLVVGTGLVGIGEILLEDGRLKLRPPEAPGTRYFLTRMSRGQLIKRIQSQAGSLKAVALVFGLLTASLLGFLTWRLTKKYLAYRKTQREFEEIRRSMLRRHAEAREERGKAEGGESPCVVCLGNPREVVTLECGHISMCCDCAEMLPAPHKCPVCREEVKRFLPIYRP